MRLTYDGRVEPGPPLPEEFVLRELMDLDLGDGLTDDVADSVVEFVSTWGMLSRPFPDLEVDGAPTDGRHLWDVWWWLRTAQALVETWERWHADEYLLPAWDWKPGAPSREEDVLPEFVELLNLGLSAMPMHATTTLQWDLLPDSEFGMPQLGLYSACCIQLASLMAEELPPHRCANETCGRAFVRQRGGAAHGQYRTVGVIYCSPACQKAQASREWRRRRAQQKGRSK